VEPTLIQCATDTTAHPGRTKSRQLRLASQNGFSPFPFSFSSFSLSPALFTFPHPVKGEVFVFSAQDFYHSAK
jgi:hypothetical protein